MQRRSDVSATVASRYAARVTVAVGQVSIKQTTKTKVLITWGTGVNYGLNVWTAWYGFLSNSFGFSDMNLFVPACFRSGLFCKICDILTLETWDLCTCNNPSRKSLQRFGGESGEYSLNFKILSHHGYARRSERFQERLREVIFLHSLSKCSVTANVNRSTFISSELIYLQGARFRFA